MELTLRQKAFLSKVIDLYREMREPLHYSVVADRLGLSKSAAYDMLRLLEERGMIASQYVTPKPSAGPGRSSILFSPTARAGELFSQLAGGEVDDAEWEEVKSRVLNSLRQSEASELSDIIRYSLAIMPQTRSPLACCAEIITAILLSLGEAKYNLGANSSLGTLLSMPGSKLGMSMMTGLAAGMMLADKVSRQLFSGFERYIERYETSLETLSAEAVEALHCYTGEVMSILASKDR